MTADQGELQLLAGRAADRLRVVGPRLAARGSAEAEAALADVRTVLQQLADLAAALENEPSREVPELAAHALGDQLLVLVGDLDVAAALADCDQHERVGRDAYASASELIKALYRRI